MEEAQLQEVIKLLDDNSSEENAFFERSYDELDDYGIIKANKDGLILYSKSLIESLYQFELRLKQKKEGDDNYINLNIGDWYIKNGFDLPMIKPVFESRNKIKTTEGTNKRSLKDHLTGLVFIAILILFIIGVFTGILKVISWF